MLINDPIGDMLTRIRNAQISKHESVEIPASNMLKSIANILLSEGFVKNVEFIDEVPQGKIKITIKYAADKKPIISGLKRISKPGLRIYAKSEEIPKVLGGLGIAVISTSKGVMTDKQARNNSVGGEVLCYVW
jgi:small subunit ribosomal protein S8